MPVKKSSTIGEVSRLAGVSISTVSRVINAPELVNAVTRQRVEAAVAQLAFKPASSLARTRARPENQPVVIFIPDLFNESFISMAQGASEYFRARDIPCLIWNSCESQNWELRGYHAMKSNQMRGAIFIISVVEDVPLPTHKDEVPVVLVERTSSEPGVDTVTTDAEEGLFLLMQHMASLGHRHIALLSGDISSDNSLRKITAYKKALAALNLQWNTNYIVPSEWSIAGGASAVRKLLVGSPEVTGVLSVTDALALGALHGLENMGIRCPADVSVAGFDNMPKGAYLRPRITTLTYPAYDMGHLAAEYLYNRFQHPGLPEQHKRYSMKVIQGDTTGPTRAR